MTSSHLRASRARNTRLATRISISPTGYRGGGDMWAHLVRSVSPEPRGWIGEYVRERGCPFYRDPTIADLARRFGVSRRAAQVRRAARHVGGGRG